MTYDTIDNDVTMPGGEGARFGGARAGVDCSIGDALTMRPGGGNAALGRIDQYELLRELGGGGFGSMYLARDTVAGIEVAVKGLPPMIRNNAEELERIRENFALVSRLHHPYIAAALHLQLAREVSYASEDVRQKLRVLSGDTLMVMEYAPGVTLSQWRRQFPGGRVPLEVAIQIVWQVAQALDYAHEQHIIHRDVKPSNVMVETKPDGEIVARILDFGLAAEIRSSMGRVSREVRDTSGTRPYMAPEQWAGRKQGPATDQYALAAMFYELLTGEVPFASVFDTGDPVVMMTAVCNREVEFPADCPRQAALRRALSKDPEQRFATCMEFIEAAAKSEQSSARSPSLVSKVAATASARRGIIVKAACAAALLAIAAIGWRITRGHVSGRVNPSTAGTGQRELDVLNEQLQNDWVDLPVLDELNAQEQERIRIEQEQEHKRVSTREFIAAFKEGKFDVAGSLIDSIDTENPDVQSCLAAMYMEGVGVDKDYAKAFLYCEKRAREGDVSAKCNLGTMYDKGFGVAKNEYAAVKWYEEAARDGYAPAQYCLGVMCENGRGLRKNMQMAQSWYRDAAQQGNDDAKVALRRLEQLELRVAESNLIVKAHLTKLETEKDVCTSCNGTGSVACARCKGSGEVAVRGSETCPTCSEGDFYSTEHKGQIRKEVKCKYCRGTGQKKPTCWVCKGKGRLRVSHGGARLDTFERCDNCGGSGRGDPEPCAKCSGNGVIEVWQTCPTCQGRGAVVAVRKATCPICDGRTTLKCGRCDGRGFTYRDKTGGEIELDGKDLFTSMSVAKEKFANSEAIIKTVLAKHIDCVVAEPVPGKDGKSPIDIDPKTGDVFANVRVHVDQTKYVQFAKEIDEKIGCMSKKKIKLRTMMDYHGGHKADGLFNYEYKYETYQFLVVTSLRSGSAFAYQLDKNVLDTIVQCLDVGFLAVEVTMLDANGTVIAEAYKSLDPRGYAYFALSLFARREDFGCVMPFYWADLNVVNGNTVQCVNDEDRGRSEGVFQVPLGKFSSDELKSVGKLKMKIRVGHVKDDQFSE